MRRNLTKLLFIYYFMFLQGCAVTRLLNAGTVHMKYTVSKAKFNDVVYENKDRIGDVSVSVRNVQHPSAYGRWATNIRLTPSIHADRQTYGTLEPDPQRAGATLPDINVRRGIAMANLKWTVHAPIGAFALTGGHGLTVTDLNDGQGLNTTRTREITKIDLAYYAFFTKKFFILFGPRYYAEEYESLVFAFRIGFYWGKKS